MFVYALTSNQAVTGEGTDTGHVYEAPVGAPGGTWANLNSDDGDTSVLHMNGAGCVGYTCYHSHTYVAFATAHNGINSVAFTFKIRTEPGKLITETPYILYSGTRYYGGALTIGYSGTYETNTYTWTLNPVTGAAWRNDNTLGAQHNINNMQFGIKHSSGTSDHSYWTYGYITIDYNPATAPTVTTSAASSIAATSATLNGNITSDGGSAITNYGFVWGTADLGDPGPATGPNASAYAGKWQVGAGSYSPIPYATTHSTGATLTHGTTYYFRAAALNSVGWAYGSAVSFNTIDHSAIAILSASNVVSTTATLNAQMTTDGGEPCSVEFVYAVGTLANYAAVAAAGGHVHAAAAGTWATGTLPTVNITGLTAATTYTVAASSINSVDVAYGTIVSGVTTFTTESGVYIPTNFVAIPTSTTISLSWVKGVGAVQTSVRYSTGGYPADYNSGTSIYLNTGNSYQLTGLTPGTTYYFSAWGYTAGVYSGTGPAYTNGKITVMSTTLAYNAPSTTPTPNSVAVAPPNSQWAQTPDATKASGIPLFGVLVQGNATAYAQPVNMMWYFIWLLLSACLGVIVFAKSNNNLTLSLFVTCFAVGSGMVIGLTMMWIIALFILIGAGWSMFGNRY